MLDFRFLANRVATKLTRQLRIRRYAAQRSPFLHRAARGVRFKLYPDEYIDGKIFVEGIYEIYELESVKRFGGGAFVDVGANIGNHALYLAPYFREVHCFEPNPVIAARLDENIALNAATITVHRVALGSEDGELPYHANTTGNHGSGSFVANDGDVIERLPVRNGDAYFERENISGISLIKIDVEGFEIEVLRGLRQVLERERPPVMFEFDARINDFEILQSLFPDEYRIDALDAKGTPEPLVREAKMYGSLLAQSTRVTAPRRS